MTQFTYQIFSGYLPCVSTFVGHYKIKHEDNIGPDINEFGEIKSGKYINASFKTK